MHHAKSLGKITLKQYIVSYNFRKQVQNMRAQGLIPDSQIAFDEISNVL